MTNALETLLNYDFEREIKNFINEVKTGKYYPLTYPTPTNGTTFGTTYGANNYNWPSKNWQPANWANVAKTEYPYNYNRRTYTTEDATVFTFDLPGFNEKTLNVEITDGYLTIEGNREYNEGTTKYTYNVNETVSLKSYYYDETKVTAEITNGVLTVTLPKTKKDKKKTVTLL